MNTKINALKVAVLLYSFRYNLRQAADYDLNVPGFCPNAAPIWQLKTEKRLEIIQPFFKEEAIYDFNALSFMQKALYQGKELALTRQIFEVLEYFEDKELFYPTI